jgi:hypothetical protein
MVVVIFHHPVHRVARQSILAGQGGNAPVLQSAQPAFLGGDPKRAVVIEMKAADPSGAEPIGGCVRLAHLAVLEISDAAQKKSNPYAAFSWISGQNTGVVLVSQSLPGDLIECISCLHVKKPKTLMCEPQVAGPVLGDGKHHGTLGDVAKRDKAPAIQIAKSRGLRDPDSTGAVLEKRGGKVIHIPGPAKRDAFDLAVPPPVQPAERAEPKASVLVCQDRSDDIMRQTLFRGQRRNREVAKAVKAVSGRHPNVALAVLKERVNCIAGEAIGLRKHIRAARMQAQKAVREGCQPKAAVVVAEYPSYLYRLCDPRQRIGVGFSLAEPLQLAIPPHQQRAVLRFTEPLYAIGFAGQRVESRWPGAPAPQSVLHPRPQSTLTIHEKVERSAADRPFAFAAHAAVANGAELAERRR